MTIYYPFALKTQYLTHHKVYGLCFIIINLDLTIGMNKSSSYSTKIQHNVIAIFVSNGTRVVYKNKYKKTLF